MTKKQFKNLSIGDRIQHKIHSSLCGVVTQNFGDRVTAVDSLDVTNPDEWMLISKATQSPVDTKDQ